MKIVDFLMIGWELDYSRNRVLLGENNNSYKSVFIKKNNFFVRQIKIFVKTFFSLLMYRTKIVYLPSFNQMNAPMIIFLAKLFRKKLIIDILVSEYDTIVHDRKVANSKSQKAKRALICDKLCIKYGDVLICDTDSHKKFFVEFFGADSEKISVIPVGAEKIFFSNKGSFVKKGNAFNVLFYGGFSPLHGIEKIIFAAEILSKENIEFTLVGGGQTKKEMLELAKKLKLKNINWIDYIKYSDLPDFIMGFDVGLGIFGLTGKSHRVVPNKVYQMASCGKPIITLDTAGIKEVFDNNQNILLVSENDNISKKIAEKILFLKNNEQFRRKIAKNAYELMEKDYKDLTIHGRFQKILRDLNNDIIK